MEPRAKWTQVAMELHGRLTDNGHGSMVSWADLGPCRPGLWRRLQLVDVYTYPSNQELSLQYVLYYLWVLSVYIC